MNSANELRAMILAALPAAVFGCSGTTGTNAPPPADAQPDITIDDRPAPPPDVPPVMDAGAPDVAALCPRTSNRECLTESQVESRLRTPPQGGGGPNDAAVDALVPLDVPRASNGCYIAMAVQDGCCNRAALVERQGELCCYTFCTGACCGRPFTVEGRARTAARAGDSPWATATTSTASLDAQSRAVIARAWRDDARMEHASVASFARFTLHLMALGAAPDLLADVQRAALDEVDHARRCFSLAASLDGVHEGPGPLDVTGAIGAVTLEEAVRAAIAEGCVGETCAALLCRRRAELATEPAVRAALEHIAEDESRHASLAWRFVAWALAAGGESVRAAAMEAFDRSLAETDVIAGTPAGVDAATWRAFGFLTANDQHAALAMARREVLRPCAAALLGDAS